MGCRGIHCDGCGGDGGGGLAALLVILLVMVVAGLHAIWPQVVRALEIIAWTLAATSGAVILAAGTAATVRVVRAVRARRARREDTMTAFPTGLRVVPAARVTVLPPRPVARPLSREVRRRELAARRPGQPGARP